jgi:hypothetical protein
MIRRDFREHGMVRYSLLRTLVDALKEYTEETESYSCFISSQAESAIETKKNVQRLGRNPFGEEKPELTVRFNATKVGKGRARCGW